MPTWLSISSSVGWALLITMGHVLIISTAAGLLLPNLLQGDTELWGTVLVSWVEPVVRLLTENHFVATIAIAVFWAIVGGLLYSVISSTITTAKEARAMQKGDPTMRFYVQLLGWHAFVGAIFVGMTILVTPFVQWIFTQNELLAHSATIAELLGHLGTITLSWIVLLHAYVVLYRLYRRVYVS